MAVLSLGLYEGYRSDTAPDVPTLFPRSYKVLVYEQTAHEI